MAAIQYNRIIRKLTVGFGNLFNNITLVRYNPDLTEAERFIIPIAYATKERYVMRLEDDYTLDKKVQVALPRMSFEMVSMTYDATRKQNTNIKNYAQTSSGIIAQYNPVPYDFDFNLYLYVRNIEDASQVLEHILPFFTPDYTLKLDLVPEMGMVKEVPVILKDADHEIIYEGPREQETRIIIWTLRFTVKAFLFGKTSTANIIKNSIVNINSNITENDIVTFKLDPQTGLGDYQIGDVVYQGYSYTTATATARVVYWDNTNFNLKLSGINGDFSSSQPIYTVNNQNGYKFVSYDMTPSKLVEINVVPEPLTANVSDNWTANTTITEFE